MVWSAGRSGCRGIAIARAGTDDEAHTKLFVVRDDFVEACVKVGEWMMCADTAQIGGV